MSHDSIPPLPRALERGARELRARAPSEGFEDRLERALEQSRTPAPRKPTSIWAGSAILVPALTTAVLLLHLTIGGDAFDGTEPLSRFEEHHVVLGEDGHAWVELDLWTHHHEGAATVNVVTPASVQVDAVADRACRAERCTHRFVSAPPRDRAPLRVRVTERGRHSITVEHTSPTQRVREHFLVHAR